ncbi:efflux RND transporter periplasmic adaptor subunit [Malonomonas rubra]|uniref:efflux RND transporter periplasmic adaptor subunit n=1 Tax=Malonomonas rubra TaxID=57040 RepID=UPI0026F2486E|nr:efflux RND transporter periplasmic adaptor subunit [Malonomonas rubra]
MKILLLLLMLSCSLLCPSGTLPGDLSAPPGFAAEGDKYTCGMHPMIVVNEPGFCPICQMELTPMNAGATNSSANTRTIHVDHVTMQRMGIRTAPAEYRTLTRQIQTVGLVSYQEPAQQAISCKISGWVEELYINENGQKVSEGDPLLALYSPDLVAAQEELLLAVKNRQQMAKSGFQNVLEDAERLHRAARERLQFWDISEQQISRLEHGGSVEKTLTLHAPTSGIVSRKMVREGEFIPAGKELLEISNISRLWLYADIYEYEIPWVRKGLQTEVRFPFSSEPVRGRIDLIYPYLEAKTRTLKARIDLKNPGLELKPDMYADVTIITDPNHQVLSIPTEAVLYTGKKETVFIALGEGHFEPRTVKIGLTDESGYAEILDGIKAGERVVTSAQFMLDSESKLREAIQKMLEPQPEEESLEDLF